MTSQANKILDELVSDGWRLISREKPVSWSYWWVWEIWTLHKRNKVIYLSYLIDPMLAKKEQSVWAVGAGTKDPQNQSDCNLLLSLGKGWEKGVTEFIHKIDQLTST